MATNDCKPLPPLSTKDISRFWNYVDVRGLDECWPWKPKNGNLKNRPCLRVGPDHTTVRSSRIAFYLYHGYDPCPLFACHTCDYPPCCNGRHLFAGTALDNSRDAMAKGRLAVGDRSGARLHPESRPRGDKHPMRLHPEIVHRGADSWPARHPERMARGERNAKAKLTEEQVLEIRGLKGTMTQKLIAERFGLHRHSISHIWYGKFWKHIS
jgi:hypothetical protein